MTITNNETIPHPLDPLFWEYDPGEISIFKHADLIMSRIMERGTWASMVWLQKTFSRNRIAGFLEKKGSRILPPRELNYWALWCEVPNEKRRVWLIKGKNSRDVWRNRNTR